MKIKVLVPFIDKINPLVKHVVGEEMEIDELRGKNLLVRGLAESLEVPVVKEETKPKRGRAKKNVEETLIDMA